MVTYLMPYILFWIGRDLAELRGVIQLFHNWIPVTINKRICLGHPIQGNWFDAFNVCQQRVLSIDLGKVQRHAFCLVSQ